MERLRLLSVVVAAAMLTAGCLGGGPATPERGTAGTTTTSTASPGETTDATPVTDTTTTTRDAHDRWLRGDVVEISAARIAEETSTPLEEVRYESRRVFAAAIENGTTVRTSIGELPDGTEGYPVRLNGSYYAVERTVRDETEVTAHDVELEKRLDQSERETVAFEELSPAARAAFRAGLQPAERRDPGDGFIRSYRYQFADGGPPGNATILDGDQHAVSFEGQTYLFTLGERTTATRRTVGYTASVVANSTAEWESVAVDRHVTTLSAADLNGTARERLIAAVEAGGIDFHSPNPSVPEWVDTLREWLDRHRYVSFQGQLYHLDIYYVME